MSPTDYTDYNGPVALATDAATGLYANNANNTAAQLLDEQQLFCDPEYLNNSPALSFFSTPDLGFLDTPDTVISHDFESVFSPQLQRDFSKASSVDQYAQPSKDPMFRDVTLFPCSIPDDSHAQHAFDFNDKHTDSSIELFVDAASLSLTPANGLSIPASPALSAMSASDALDMPPPRARPMNLGKLQRGRKRKSSTDDGEYSPSLLKRSFTDEDEIKIALRAKNTEAAARSRARKRAAMEDAEARIAELEEENRKLRADLADLRAQHRA